MNTKEVLAASTFKEMDKDGDGQVREHFIFYSKYFLKNPFEKWCLQVTASEFTAAILGHDKFSRLLAVTLMQMFV